MIAADTIQGKIETEVKSPSSGRAAMSTPLNPNAQLAHEVRDWLATIGHAPHEEYEVIVRRCRDQRRVGSLLVPPDVRTMLPPRPVAKPSDVAASFLERLSGKQKKLLAALVDGPLIGTELAKSAGLANRQSLYSGHGIGELIDWRLVENDEESGYRVTALGEDVGILVRES